MNPRKLPSILGTFFAALVVVIAARADVERPESGDVVVEGDAVRLYGTWILKSIEIQGNAMQLPNMKKIRITFRNDGTVVSQQDNQRKETGRYKIDDRKWPRQLVLIEDKNGDKTECIYAINGDQLRLVASPSGPKGKRPRGFDDKDALIMHLERQKR